MLQKLNERIQGVVAWVVIVLVAITFTLFGIDYYMQSRHNSNVQAEVNGQVITKDAFELNYRRARQIRDPAQMTVAFEKQLKQQVLDDMIVNTVSVEAAQGNGFEVSPEQANAAILNIPQFQQDGHFSSDRYKQALSGALFTPESFQKEVRQGMVLNQQRFAFIGTAFALPNEIKQFVKLYMQTRDYDYARIEASQFAKHLSIKDSEITAYYAKHKDDFVSPEKVSVDYIKLSMPAIKQKIIVSEAQLNNYYEQNKNNYQTPAQWQLAHIFFALPTNASLAEEERIKQHAEQIALALEKNPQEFTQDVKIYSDDKASIAAEGVLPWITAGQSELDSLLVKMTKPGQIEGPVKTKLGFEIFKLVAFKPATMKTFSEVKESIKQQLLADEAQAKYAEALEKLSDLSFQTPDSLAPAAKALKTKIEHSSFFSREGGKDDLSKNKQVINAAFSHDVLEMSNNSEPIQVDNETVVVLRLAQRDPSVMKTAEEVKPLISQKLAKEKAKIIARDLGKKLLALDQQSALQSLEMVKYNNLQWHPVIHATRDFDANLAVVNEIAFNLPRVGLSKGQSMANGDYIIVRLNKVNDGQILALDKEQVSSITQQIETNYGMLDYDLYVSSLMKTAKINK